MGAEAQAQSWDAPVHQGCCRVHCASLHCEKGRNELVGRVGQTGQRREGEESGKLLWVSQVVSSLQSVLVSN